jgi:hypothetical protein
LSKMGQHKNALEIYVFKLKDYAKAEKYDSSLALTNSPAIAFSSTRKQILRRPKLAKNQLFMSSIPSSPSISSQNQHSCHQH